MYAVVGCPDCGALKIVEGRPETTTCPRCGRRSTFATLRQFHRADSLDAAQAARSRLLAERAGADPDAAAVDDAAAEAAGVDDDEYLDARGADPDAAAAAGERTGRGSGESRRETVECALDRLDRPTEDEVVAYAAERGVPRVYVERALEELRERGEVTVTDGRYRLL